MKSKLSNRSRSIAAVLGTCLVVTTFGLSGAATKANASNARGESSKTERDDDRDDDRNDDRFTIAMLGDIPYGDAQVATFPSVISQINSDPDVRMVTHLGDIKAGSTRCDDNYFATIRSLFDRFEDPLVYTPGDNEWTDCHRPNNGAYNPLERLSAVRSVFFPAPGRTLGQKAKKVKSQESAGFPENVRYDREDVEFAAIHIVGSNNGLVNWTGRTSPTPEQLAEVNSRTAAALQWINETFDRAMKERRRAVVLQIQADMFDPTLPTKPVFAQWSGFQTIVQTIAARSASFGRPVYLFDGDSHVYNVDNPLAGTWPAKFGAGSWLSFYGVSTPAPNLTRITVDGAAGVNNWLKVTINDEKDPNVLSWTKVPFVSSNI